MHEIDRRVYLGFDYGSKYIGVAIAHHSTLQSSPLTQIRNFAPHQVSWDKIKQLIKTWRPCALVVGVPYNPDYTNQQMTQAAQAFAQQLEQETKIVVHKVDEHLSSHSARTLLTEHQAKDRSKSAIDCLAAQIILQDWLNQIGRIT